MWSWDITKLHGPAKWTYFYLYVILDIFSRYPVGWMVAPRESAVLAERLIAEAVRKQHVDRGQLTLHADRGSSMASKPVAFLLADLGVTKSHSPAALLERQPVLRGAVQDPEVPARLPRPVRLHRGRPGRSATGFFGWYNHEHRHSGIGLHTPADVHYGRAHAVREARGRVLDAAYPPTPNGSSASTPSRRSCPAPSGSTSPRTRRSRLSS